MHIISDKETLQSMQISFYARMITIGQAYSILLSVNKKERLCSRPIPISIPCRDQDICLYAPHDDRIRGIVVIIWDFPVFSRGSGNPQIGISIPIIIPRYRDICLFFPLGYRIRGVIKNIPNIPVTI